MPALIHILFALAAGQVSGGGGTPPPGQDNLSKLPREGGTFRFQVANDAFTGSDDYFSNGWIISWNTRGADRWEDLAPGWLSGAIGAMPFMNGEPSQKRITLGISQLIFTPSDIENPELIVNDVPYAGALLFAISCSRQDPDSQTAWQIVTGMVGPASLAEETQDFVHKTIRTPVAEGWSHQLDDEFILNVHFQHKHKFLRAGDPDGWGFEWGGVAAAAVGNLTTQVDAGIEIRAGWRMPAGFDPDPIGRALLTHGYLGDRVENPISAHFFASAAARGWARFIFLDGNTWKESHDIERNTWTAVFGGGVTAAFYRFRVTLEFGATSQPAEGEGGFESFGSLTFAYTF
jgi:lipid A 3-O-deacylase